MIWWIIGAIIAYLVIGVIFWIFVIATDGWGSLFLYPLYALLLIVGWLPIYLINLAKEAKEVSEWYKDIFVKREEKQDE
ncbi:hypothetical protein BC01_035 [Bacillus phage BC01]|nr:hypothetical protein BC01_035 [Bacillus phage BC01]